MSYYTDKVYSSNFLSKSRGLDEMLVQDKSEERPPLPESSQAGVWRLAGTGIGLDGLDEWMLHMTGE